MKESLITDHAIVRWFERVLNADIVLSEIRRYLEKKGSRVNDRSIVDAMVEHGTTREEIQKIMLDETAIAAIKLGCTTIRQNGAIYRIGNRMVVTVYKKNKSPKRKR